MARTKEEIQAFIKRLKPDDISLLADMLEGGECFPGFETVVYEEDAKLRPDIYMTIPKNKVSL